MLRNPFYRGVVRTNHWGIETEPFTASLSRGKTGQRYGYYRCWNKECGAV